MGKAKEEFICIHKDGSRRSLYLVGRDAWCLNELINAGNRGVTPINNPAPRIGAYVFNLRQLGLDIETKYETHGGAFAGVHGRYILKSIVERVSGSEAA